MLPSLVVYGGLLVALAGFVLLVKPLARLGIATRGRAAGVAAGGLVLALGAMAWPAPLQTATDRRSALDDFMPAYHFNEVHALRVHAPPTEVYRAVREVTADEIFLFRTLTWIRNPNRPWRGEEDILNAPAHKPILAVATESTFRVLAEAPGEEIVLGTVVIGDAQSHITTAEEFRAFRRPGNALATINFRVQDDGGGWSRVTTETRIFATDEGARRRFAAYWRVIYPGSWLIRYFWLRAVRTRAEKALAG